MNSFIAPFEVSVSFSFSKDKCLYEVTITLQKGDETGEVVDRIVKENGIPSYFKGRIKEIIFETFQAEIKKRSRKYVIDLFSRPDFQTTESKKLEFYKVFHQVFSIKSLRPKLARLEKDINSIFNGKIKEKYPKINIRNFFKLQSRVLNDLERMKIKQKKEYEIMISEIYQKKEPLENLLNLPEEEEDDDEEDEGEEDFNSEILRNPRKSLEHGLSILFNERYEKYEVFTNEDILNSYTYYTQKTISIFVVFSEEKLGRMLSSFDSGLEIQQRLHNLTNLYQNRLSVLVTTFTPVYEKRKMVSFQWCPWMNEILYSSQITYSPELHFEDFGVQKKSLLKDINREKLYPLQSGEYFITKHSNLNHVHMIYHLKISEENKKNVGLENANDNEDLELRRGLSDIFYKCCFTDANDLFIKIPFIPQEKRTISSHFKEFEMVISCFQEGFLKNEKFRKTERVNLNNFFVFVPMKLYGNEKFKDHIKRIIRDKFKVKKPQKKKKKKNIDASKK